MLSSPPPHWSIRRLKSIARIVNGGTPSSTVPEYWDGNIIWLTPDDLGKLNTAYVKTGSRSITQEGYNACSTTLAPAGSIAVSTRAPIGHTAILEADACVNQGCRILVPDGTIRTRYLYRSLTALKHELETRGKGTTFAELSYGDLGTVPILVPPPAEQAAIVRYLDHADELINRYITIKERLIALLEEQRQAVIQQAVTRGLDPNVPLKPSGVDWLGDVPERWEVRRLSQIAISFRTGPFGSMLHQSDYIEGGTPVINPVHMRSGEIFEDPKTTVSEAVAEKLSSYRLGLHDLVFSRRGELGRCALVRDHETNWLCGTGSIGVRISYCGIEPEFLIQTLQALWVGEYLSAFSVGTTMANLNTGILKSIPIALPPHAEQTSIVEYLDNATTGIDTAITRARRQIELVEEYRTRLTADAVTGQIDVRDATVELPD